MIWLVEKDIFFENESRLKECLGDRLIFCERSISGFYKPEREIDDEVVIFYGSLSLGRALSKRTKFITWLPDYRFDCTYYSHHFGTEFLNCDHVLIEAGGFEQLYEKCLKGVPIFVKDNSGYKNLTGQIFDDFSLAEIRNMFYNEVLWISPVKEVGSEWRFIIESKDSHDIVSHSLYVDKESSDEGLLDYTSSLLQSLDYYPAPFWTLDIAAVGESYKVVEINSLLTAGWYQADVAKIIERVENEVRGS